MTWTQALTTAAEVCISIGIIGFTFIGAIISFSLAYHALRGFWRRIRVRHELSAVEKLSLEALARYRRDMRL